MKLNKILNNEVLILKEYYSSERPYSKQLQNEAESCIPGGTTRTVLTFEPFPFRVKEANSTDLIDVDGFTYIDFCGDHTNGLFGHTCKPLIDAISDRLKSGWSIGSTHELEIQAATLICKRFKMEKVRFTNSGTEANLLAISLCMYLSKKRNVLVFRNGFHGSLLSFNVDKKELKNELNVPYNFIIGEYNKVEELEQLFKDNNIGCAIVEPMQGSGGCIPANQEFLKALRELCNKYEAYLIFDEVMTSRLHPHGLQAHYSIKPDITTLGKYLGGGFSFGAFGGCNKIMKYFEGCGTKLRHSGTFNNNIASMSACIEVLTKLYLEEDAIILNRRGDELRESLKEVFVKYKMPITLSGFGSMMHFHAQDIVWIKWIFYSLLNNGIYIAPNGLISLSLEIKQKQIDKLVECCDNICHDLCIKIDKHKE